ncbi:prepilin-type N-terminal cleavage/methylation domain-containing protein [bacterium]|nr:prepilin-type N-terminal cleavage/methylation domain-containing protein [bacterium]
MRARIQRQGFSLIETLLCATILCICLGIIVVLIPTGYLSLKDSERRIYAASLAQKVLEEKRNTPLESLDALGNQLQMVEEVYYDGISYRCFFQSRPYSTVTYARQLKVVVEWPQHQQTQRVVRESVECRVRR